MSNTFAKNILKAIGIEFKDKDISSFTANVIDKIIEMNSTEAGFYIVLPYMHLRYEKGKTIEECKELAQFKEFFDKYAVDAYEESLLRKIKDYSDVITATYDDPYKKFINVVRDSKALSMKYKKLRSTCNELSNRLDCFNKIATCSSDEFQQIKHAMFMASMYEKRDTCERKTRNARI